MRKNKERDIPVKKKHSLKNTVITTMQRFIIFLGATVEGSKHDYGLLKSEFCPDKNWFKKLVVWLDLGYLGFQKDYEFWELNQPIKKPRKSKKNPDPKLSKEQKEYNRQISQKRIIVEHAIGGMKRYKIVGSKLRMKCKEFADTIIFLCAGLWNFKLSLKS